MFFFFFQAEDGIRDGHVTGVQTCALPIYDRPGVMLAGAVRTYVNRYAVAPGRRAVVFTTNDSGYEAAIDLADAGIDVAAVVDPRTDAAAQWLPLFDAR